MIQDLSDSNDAENTEEDSDDFVYKSLSRAAMLSLVFGLFSLLAWISPMLLFLPIIGMVFGIVGLKNLKKYPNELIGTSIAWIGLVMSVVILIGSPAKHIYVYNTEVPEGFERVQFAVLNSPIPDYDFPTPEARALNGKKIFLKGYVHPTSISSNSSKTFVLVPDFGTCCFGTQPKLTHMIQVRLVNDGYAHKDLRQHSLAGIFEVHDFKRQVEGLDGVFYELEAEHFQ